MMLHSFLMVGQSNMAGRGELSDLPPIDNPNLYVLRNGRWQKMYRPVNPDRPFSGISLAERFADRYQRDHGVKVGLIPCADGGTSLARWCVGGLLYDNAVNTARLALRTSEIAGILWHQGEADCTPDCAPTYAERAELILSSMRRDLGLEDVPLLVGGLADFLGQHKAEMGEWAPTVNDQLRLLAGRMARTAFVDGSGLPPKPDHLHFCAEGAYAFGDRYYEEFLKIEDKNRVFREKCSQDEAVRTAMELL